MGDMQIHVVGLPHSEVRGHTLLAAHHLTTALLIEILMTGQSTVSIASSEGEPLECGIRLPPGTSLQMVNLLDLRPTQAAVGMQQVEVKTEKVHKKQSKGPEQLDAFLRRNPIPVVLGPGGLMYLIDHHHLGSALYRCGVTSCYVGVARDLSGLPEDEFWNTMAQQRLVWLHDHQGQRIDLQQLRQHLPKDVSGLKDDPYRSLAALVRKAGGYNKSTIPFSEFMWANFLRPRVPMVLMAVRDVETYVGRALSRATAEEATQMPGYTSLQAATAEQLDLMADQGAAPGEL